MAGPGIRTRALAREVAAALPTCVAAPRQASPETGALPPEPFDLCFYDLSDWASLAPLVAESDVCIAPGDIVVIFPEIVECAKTLVIDGYTPLMAEYLALWSSLPLAEQMARWNTRAQMLSRQYSAGDFFLCASERQRDWWLGLLESHGRINPATLQADPSLRRLVDVVPYGLDDSPLTPTGAAIRGVWPGIGADDKLLLWGGGLWPWLDPLTAIRAVHILWQQRQDIRLIFPGTRHPNPVMAETPTGVAAARLLAAELGLLDRAIFFGDWIPYAAWGDVLLESDVALSLHFDTLETRLAFRSRIFDYIRAGLPAVVNGGDATAEIVARYGVGLTAPFADAAAVADAVATLLAEPRTARGAGFAAARHDLTWTRAAAPLLHFCRDPRRAADRDLLGARLGNPAQLALADQLAQAHTTIAAYEAGAFMRLMRGLDSFKRRLMPPATGARRPAP